MKTECSRASFDDHVRRIRLETGELRFECKLGRWAVEGRDEEFVYNEARRYFFQYYNDNEYAVTAPGVNTRNGTNDPLSSERTNDV